MVIGLPIEEVTEVEGEMGVMVVGVEEAEAEVRIFSHL